jgi:hypothetical protein
LSWCSPFPDEDCFVDRTTLLIRYFDHCHENQTQASYASRIQAGVIWSLPAMSGVCNGWWSWSILWR